MYCAYNVIFLMHFYNFFLSPYIKQSFWVPVLEYGLLEPLELVCLMSIKTQSLINTCIRVHLLFGCHSCPYTDRSVSISPRSGVHSDPGFFLPSLRSLSFSLSLAVLEDEQSKSACECVCVWREIKPNREGDGVVKLVCVRAVQHVSSLPLRRWAAVV